MMSTARPGTRSPLEEFRRFAPPDGGIPRLPALDGLRGVAVAGVVAFHVRPDLLPAGYLGVSTFFTLSGFLITSLLLAERASSGSISLREFWRRRGRRLIPAAWATVALTLVAGWVSGVARPSLAGDALASVGQVANWRFLLSEQSYADLFSSPSLLQHFWSLAIEEQFYLVMPLVVAGSLAVARGRHWLVGSVFGVVAVALGALSFAGLDGDRVYYGTDLRAPELLIGALLAVAVAQPGVRRALSERFWVRSVHTALAMAAVAATVVAWRLIDVPGTELEPGTLLVHATAIAIVIANAIVPSGPLHRLLSVRPLRWLGEISYGVYLIHWPLLVIVDETLPDVAPVVRDLAVVATSLVVATISNRVMETPLRRWGRVGVLSTPAVCGLWAIAIVGGSVAVGNMAEPVGVTGDLQATRDEFAERIDRLREQAENAAPSTSPSTVEGSSTTVQASTTTTIPPAPMPTVSVFGDSVALTLGLQLAVWLDGQTPPPFLPVDGVAKLGCGVTLGGLQRFGAVSIRPMDCGDWPKTWATALDAGRPNIAVLHSVLWDSVDRNWEDGVGWVSPGHPHYDEKFLQDYRRALDLLAESTDLVIVLNVPRFGQANVAEAGSADVMVNYSDERVDHANRLLAQVVAERPGEVAMVDLHSWYEEVPGRVDSTDLRPDGSHYPNPETHPEGDIPVTETAGWVGSEILRLWQEWWIASHGG